MWVSADQAFSLKCTPFVVGTTNGASFSMETNNENKIKRNANKRKYKLIKIKIK